MNGELRKLRVTVGADVRTQVAVIDVCELGWGRFVFRRGGRGRPMCSIRNVMPATTVEAGAELGLVRRAKKAQAVDVMTSDGFNCNVRNCNFRRILHASGTLAKLCV